MVGLAPIHIKPLLEIHCFLLADQHHYVTERTVSDLREMGLIQKRAEWQPGDSTESPVDARSVLKRLVVYPDSAF